VFFAKSNEVAHSMFFTLWIDENPFYLIFLRWGFPYPNKGFSHNFPGKITTVILTYPISPESRFGIIVATTPFI
jgi:hypothetical protein